jgi:hypothetical protein
LLTTRYHIGSIIAIFVALGIGILIGGTLGQKWMHQTENSIVELLMERYEQQLTFNQLLQKQIGSLQLMNQTVSPIFHHKKIVWIRPQSEKNEVLPLAMKAAGADWVEKNSDMVFAKSDLDFENTLPDIIMISDPEISKRLTVFFDEWRSSGKQFVPKVIDVSSERLDWNKPEDVVNFVLYLKKVIEEESHATIGYYRYPGVE